MKKIGRFKSPDFKTSQKTQKSYQCGTEKRTDI